MGSINDYSLSTVKASDGPNLAKNNVAAFWGEPGWNIMFHKDTLESLTEKVMKRTSRNLVIDQLLKRHEIVIHEPTGEIVGYARWKLPESHKDDWPAARVPEVSAEESARYIKDYNETDLDFREGLPIGDEHSRVWKEMYGPFGDGIYLDYLATGPNHQRKGIARMLVKSGLEKADELNLPVWTYATTYRSVPMYQSLGFVLYDEKHADLRAFGRDASYDTYHLIRPAKDADIKGNGDTTV